MSTSQYDQIDIHGSHMYSRSPSGIEYGLKRTKPASQAHTNVDKINQKDRNLIETRTVEDNNSRRPSKH